MKEECDQLSVGVHTHVSQSLPRLCVCRSVLHRTHSHRHSPALVKAPHRRSCLEGALSFTWGGRQLSCQRQAAPRTPRRHTHKSVARHNCDAAAQQTTHASHPTTCRSVPVPPALTQRQTDRGDLLSQGQTHQCRPLYHHNLPLRVM